MKRKKTAKVKTSKRKVRGSEDARTRKKYKRGGRIEAYTFGEVSKNPNWPY